MWLSTLPVPRALGAPGTPRWAHSASPCPPLPTQRPRVQPSLTPPQEQPAPRRSLPHPAQRPSLRALLLPGAAAGQSCPPHSHFKQPSPGSDQATCMTLAPKHSARHHGCCSTNVDRTSPQQCVNDARHHHTSTSSWGTSGPGFQ